MLAAAICIPDPILIGACDFPGDLIAGRCLLDAYRCDCAKLTRCNGGAGIFQFRAKSGAIIIKKNNY